MRPLEVTSNQYFFDIFSRLVLVTRSSAELQRELNHRPIHLHVPVNDRQKHKKRRTQREAHKENSS